VTLPAERILADPIEHLQVKNRSSFGLEESKGGALLLVYEPIGGGKSGVRREENAESNARSSKGHKRTGIQTGKAVIGHEGGRERREGYCAGIKRQERTPVLVGEPTSQTAQQIEKLTGPKSRARRELDTILYRNDDPGREVAVRDLKYWGKLDYVFA